jgi:hypothetical protein
MALQTPHELKVHDFHVTVRSEKSAAHIERVLDALIHIGLGDATDTLERGEGDTDAAQMAVDADFTAPVLIGDTDLNLCTLRPVWTAEDSAAALAEGWDIFCVDGSYHDIQRYDEADVYSEDTQAIADVVWRASAGSALHRKALAIITHPTNHPPLPSVMRRVKQLGD